jgi:MFS family permease
VIAPLVLAELDADPAWVGVYYGLAAAASLVAQMGCGSFIVRYGALRMSQVALVLLGGGMAVAAQGTLPGFAASAIIGGGAAVSTPTSSQLLGRVSPPRLAPLVFSIKQTAVPAGLLITGFLAPTMAPTTGMIRPPQNLGVLITLGPRVCDSPLEGDGFEDPVPRQKGNAFTGAAE